MMRTERNSASMNRSLQNGAIGNRVPSCDGAGEIPPLIISLAKRCALDEIGVHRIDGRQRWEQNGPRDDWRKLHAGSGEHEVVSSHSK